ncbi:uncharacterized protein L3040_008948 [Drepanopeziza brunnea f. sp. 'multigermtubi']|uniref:uncharacterized protein n=1 Tax=Drepanopeziza brunnea f. sp. 'multigermtubi' TaxID=698441 RepID=UPI0023A58B18|nr:hypothetical protein L3040_008948 [Drepanopeziza brunnea f. sp. 'multigermtubi']
MASLEPVWAGRNSGNDTRNSDGPSSSEDGGYNGEGGVKIGGVVSSADGRRLNMVRTEIPSSTQGSESQIYSQQRVDDHDAPPSSQPQPVSSEGEDEDDQDATMGADAEPGFIDFKTPFLAALLPQNSPRTQHDLLQIKTSVQDFAEEHPFWTQSILVEEEAVEFEKDVFEFAKAAGLTVNLAKVEVMRAMGKWKAAKGVRIGEREDSGSVGLGLGFGLLVNSIERGDEAGVERGSGNKRKRGGKVAERVGELVDAGVAQPSTKRQKRRNRKKRSSGLAVSEPNNGQDGTPTPKTKVFKVSGEVATSESKAKAMSSRAVKDVTSAKVAKMEKRRQKKLRAKQGPITSSHFPPKVYSLPNSTTQMETKTGSSLGAKNDGKDKEVLENDIDKIKEAVVPNSVAAGGKKRRKRKRNKNSLPATEVEAQLSKVARALAPAGKSKQLTPGNASPPRTKKKRVRSRLSKVATATKAIEEGSSVPEATVDVTKSVVEPTHAELPAEPEEQPPKKSRNRRRTSRLEAEKPPAPIATAAEAEPDTVPILSEKPAKKRARDRGRKSLGKADVKTDSAEKPDLPLAPVTELPDETFKKEKKSKRDESRKRSITMPDIQGSEALNSIHS